MTTPYTHAHTRQSPFVTTQAQSLQARTAPSDASPPCTMRLMEAIQRLDPSGSLQCQHGIPQLLALVVCSASTAHGHSTSAPFKGHNNRAAQATASGPRQRPLNGRTFRWQHCMAVVATEKGVAHHCRRRSSSGTARRRAPWRTCHATPCAGTCSPDGGLRKCWLQACQGGSRASCRCCIRQTASGRTCRRT